MKNLIAVLAVLVAAPCFAEDLASASVYFDTASTELRPAGKVALDVIAKSVRGDDLVVQVDSVGSADSRKFNTNDKLSLARAEAVKTALVTRGVNAALIKVSSNSDRKPVCSEKTEACFAKNRRVDVSVVRAVSCNVTMPEKTVIVEKIVERIVEKDVPWVVEVEKPSDWEIMAFGQFGVHKNTNGYPSPTDERLHGKFNNWGTWQFGTEFHYKPVPLGLRIQAGNNGIGAIAQVFPVQGRLNWYVGPGLAFTAYPFYRPTAPEVERYWDLQLWTGVEYAFTKHLIGLADLRVNLPLPRTDVPALTGKNVTDSLKQTAAFVGLGYRF